MSLRPMRPGWANLGHVPSVELAKEQPDNCKFYHRETGLQVVSGTGTSDGMRIHHISVSVWEFGEPGPRAAKDIECMRALLAFGQVWNDYTEKRSNPLHIARNFFKVIE